MLTAQPGRQEPVNILLVDDQPAKLLSYEVILEELGDRLIKAHSAREALTCLLKEDVALVLIDVCMPDLDGIELATLIRQHPRHERTAIIFVSAIQVTELDSLRGYEAGAVDYVPVPVVPEVLRAKVRVFTELYRKTRDLERLNTDLERLVGERTAELEAAAAQLRESEHRRSLALAAGRMGSWEWDLVGDRHVWDKEQSKLFGLAPSEHTIDAARVSALLHPDDADRVRKAADRAASTGESYLAEFRVVQPNGAVRWCVANGAVTLDADGRPARLSGVTHDITERKLAEEALQRSNELLEQRVAERTLEREMALAQLFEAQKIDTIGQLTGGVAHDFNNLLMVVLGSLELLKKRLVADDARSHRLLDNAVSGARRGAALTQRLLAFARRQELKPETVDVAQLIDGMDDLLVRALGPGVLINKDLPSELPHVLVDANQLELAILNLSVNARDAMPLEGTLAIQAREHLVGPEVRGGPPGLKAGDYIRIDVSDTGTGMDPETLARATEPFFTTKGIGKGTGLGLSMVQGLAAQSGGAMAVRSAIGAGTTVSLWLPKAARHGRDVTVRVPRGEAEASGSVPRTAQLCILLVDDDALVSTGTAAMLEDLGHRVIEAASGQQALELFQSRGDDIDLMITDYAMPGMNGLELATMIRKTRTDFDIVVASGFADLSEVTHLGELARLAKPFTQTELSRVIEETVGARLSGNAEIVALRPAATRA